MKSKNIVQRKATQVAQNTRHNKEFVDDFVTNGNEQIECFNIPASHVVNIVKPILTLTWYLELRWQTGGVDSFHRKVWIK